MPTLTPDVLVQFSIDGHCLEDRHISVELEFYHEPEILGSFDEEPSDEVLEITGVTVHSKSLTGAAVQELLARKDIDETLAVLIKNRLITDA